MAAGTAAFARPPRSVAPARRATLSVKALEKEKLKTPTRVLFTIARARLIKRCCAGHPHLIRGELPPTILIGPDEGSRVTLATGEDVHRLRPNYAD